MNKIYIFLMSIGTACLAMTQEQQRAAWRAMNSAPESLKPREEWWHEMTIQPHKKELETARQMYREMGIKPPFLRTSFLGDDAEDVAQLRSGYNLASASRWGVQLGPRMLAWLGSTDPWYQSMAKQTLAHEDTHLENKDIQNYADRLNMGLPYEMWQRWNFNSKRRDEFNADKRGYEKLPLNDLMRVRDMNVQLAEQEPKPHSPLHPSHREKVLMIDEELERRKTGNALSEAESPAAQSFFERSYHPNKITNAELASIVDELKWLDKPENKSQKEQRIKDVGGGLFELEGKRHGFWLYYGQLKDGRILLIPRPPTETKQESEKEAREILSESYTQ